jgi:hypothetical protein
MDENQTRSFAATLQSLIAQKTAPWMIELASMLILAEFDGKLIET